MNRVPTLFTIAAIKIAELNLGTSSLTNDQIDSLERLTEVRDAIKNDSHFKTAHSFEDNKPYILKDKDNPHAYQVCESNITFDRKGYKKIEIKRLCSFFIDVDKNDIKLQIENENLKVLSRALDNETINLVREKTGAEIPLPEVEKPLRGFGCLR